MSQNPTTLIGVYMTNPKTMQCLPPVSLLAEVSLSIEPPAIKPWKSVLAPVCDPTTEAQQLA